MLQQKEAVIFDMDGSLVDSMWVWKDIDIEYLGRFGLDIPDDLQQEIEGMSFTETARYFRDRFGLDRSVEQIRADWNEMAWDKYRSRVMLKPGAREFLDYCRSQGIKLGIATSNSREIVDMVMEARGVADYFSCITTACEAKKGKPAPDVYLLTAQQLSVDPKNCLVFEDIVFGIQAGKAAGMEVCAVDDAYSAYQEAEKRSLADYYIKDFREIQEIASIWEKTD
ncbi:MAG: HAD family phosphatase [Lachnospiraceae bacterium]|mgnify:CR=1 FL=1|jgi:16S rRNA pseudouridine516 synthase|nr:HAD family phosphatase [Lachnospiraceae bacterium]